MQDLRDGSSGLRSGNTSSACGGNAGSDGLRVDSSSNKFLFVEFKISIIVGALRNVFGISAFAIEFVSSDLENSSNGATIFPGDTRDTNEVLSTIFRMSMLAENANGNIVGTLENFFFLIINLFAPLDLISPFANPILIVISQTGSAGESVAQTVSALEKSSAIVRIGEGAIKPGAIGSGNGWLDF